MPNMIIDCLVAILAVLLAGVKSLHFVPANLSDFELAKRVKAGDNQAADEQRLRREWPKHQALQRIVAAIIVVIMAGLLLSIHSAWLALVWLLFWLLLAEVLSVRRAVIGQSQKLVVRYRPQLFKIVAIFRPVLKLLADHRQKIHGQSARFYSKQELAQLMGTSHGVLSADEKQLITSALSYNQTIVERVMTPLKVAVTVSPDDTVGPVLLDRLHKSKQTHFAVLDATAEQIVGVLDTHQDIPLKRRAQVVADLMDGQVVYVPQSQSLDHILQAFLQTGRHLFIVVNESKEPTGVISIENTIQHILGRQLDGQFNEYQDLRAVAVLAAATRQKSAPAKQSTNTIHKDT